MPGMQRVAMVTFGSSTLEDYVLKNMTRHDAAKEEAAERAAEAAAREETKLRIAWQYEKFAKKSVNPGHSSSAVGKPALGVHKSPMMRSRSPWCHDFDISKPPSKEEVESTLQQGSGCTYTLAPGDLFVAKTLSHVKEFCQSIETSSTVGRFVIPSLGGVEWSDACDSRLLGLLLLLKQQAQQTHLCIFISVPLQEMSPSLAAKMCHIVDSVIDLQSVEDMSQVVKLSPDPRTVAGHLEIRKLPAFGAPSAPLPQITSYVIRHKRRRITIRPVEVDPDAEFQQQEGHGGGGDAMTMACGGGPPRTRDTFDF